MRYVVKEYAPLPSAYWHWFDPLGSRMTKEEAHARAAEYMRLRPDCLATVYSVPDGIGLRQACDCDQCEGK